jgi:hypothetical protein
MIGVKLSDRVRNDVAKQRCGIKSDAAANVKNNSYVENVC